MKKIIDYISINNFFWIQFKGHLITFGFKGLPENIHFTIGFDDRSPDINLHVTKNVSDPNNKPKIKIVVINKKLLEENLPSLVLSLLNNVLEPLDMTELKNKYDYNLGFISFDSLQNSSTISLTERNLIDSFRDIAKFRKKSRLKIEGDIEKRLESFATSKEMQSSIFKNMVELPCEFLKPVKGGMIISKEKILQLICINERWYKIRSELLSLEILTAIIDKTLTKDIIWKIKRALVTVKNATTFADTKYFDNPIRLIIK